MPMRNPLAAALAPLLAAGCAATGSNVAAPAAPSGEGATLGALADSAIPKGECGMVLWAIDEDRPHPVFRYLVGKNRADVMRGGAGVSLTRTAGEGASSYGVFERQTFDSGAGLTLAVEARFSLPFDGGSYLEKGVIVAETGEGWRTLIPVAGLAGCRP